MQILRLDPPFNGHTIYMKTIQVVAAVIERDGELLCVQRGSHKFLYIHQKWEFPGGKVEAGESETDALRREIYEELDLAIEVKAHLTTVRHTYPDFHIVMAAYRCALLSGISDADIRLKEHIACRWINPGTQEFRQLDWAAADIPIVTALQG